ncbi:hypothetical protein GQ600_18955 [Phytophthora cactorum]|nr:hypothetical protein GQ600_18955 [Phytophthora cactorum]
MSFDATHQAKKAAKADSAVAARIRANLDDESKQTDSNTGLRAQGEFWTRMRAILAANEASFGLDALDALALAFLEAVVLLLPSPVLQQICRAQAHTVFQASAARPRSSKRYSSRTPPKVPPAKKQRTSKKAKAKRFSFGHSDDIDKIHPMHDHISYALPVAWATTWYDLAKFPALHQKHWLFWTRSLTVFLKASVLQACLQLLSAFIDVMGYYVLLSAFKGAVLVNLMWFSGKAVKYSSGPILASNQNPAFNKIPPFCFRVS